MTMSLVPLQGGKPIPLEKAIVFCGRGPECDIILNTSRKISRKHCCIAQIDNYLIVRDLDSMNGVKVNSKAVHGESRLGPGDELWIGDVGFRVQSPETEGIPPPPKLKAPKQQKSGADPRSISQDIPVVIPEEGGKNRQKKSAPQRAVADDEIIELSEDEIIDI